MSEKTRITAQSCMLTIGGIARKYDWGWLEGLMRRSQWEVGRWRCTSAG